MTQKRTKSFSLREMWDYEAKHPVVFAAPRALAEARMIDDLNKARTARLLKGRSRSSLIRRVSKAKLVSA